MKKRVLITALFSLVFLMAATAFASEAAAEHGSPVMEWVWKIVNFAVLVTILVVFAGKPLKGFLRKRTELIEKTLQEAKEAKDNAAKALREVEERLKGKDKEIEEIIALSRAAGEKEREALIKEGERMSVRAVEQAKANIEFELERAKAAVRAEAVGLALELAEKKLGERLTPDVQKKLLEESLAKLEGKK